jgi:polyisoprenoid-binding protein YceI
MNTTSATASSATPSPSLSTASLWAIDGSHSSVTFSVRHMMISNVRGEFQKVVGDVAYDPENVAASKLSVTIDVGSISTREGKRDAHLLSADFFDAAAYPTITFVATSVKRHGEGLDIVGDLTIRGATREVMLKVDELTREQTDPYGNHRIGATAAVKIRRSDFGLTWNAALEAGGVLVGDEISISLDIELIKQA